MKISFKLAKPSDAEIIMEFIQEFYEYDRHPFDDRTVYTALIRLLNDESLGRVWVIQDASDAIGYIVLTFAYSLEYRGRDAFIDEFYIRESHRRQGVGRKTIQFVEGVCPSLGIQALHIEVERNNTAAQRFYRKVEFEDQDSYLMTKWTIA
ncbi:MAG TPA: GNAT family N-acetyltransferase [Allocoleopsis sp.]